MRFSQRILICALAATAMVVSAGAAMAHGFDDGTMNMVVPSALAYSGSWPVTVTHSQRSNSTSCLTLIETSRNGGAASLVTASHRFPNGTFQIFNIRHPNEPTTTKKR